jgi:hypothetical protein
LLNLGSIRNAPVPETWEGANYDFFWIIDYTQDQPTFVSIPQRYAAPEYAEVPDNGWGDPVDRARFPKFYQQCE